MLTVILSSRRPSSKSQNTMIVELTTQVPPVTSRAVTLVPEHASAASTSDFEKKCSRGPKQKSVICQCQNKAI